jgi:tRNA A-37 threonylcarbamoyl transferase component Bud32
MAKRRTSYSPNKTRAQKEATTRLQDLIELESNVPIELPELYGFVSRDFQPENPPEEASRVVDPSAAQETIHWGRNYLYSTSWSAKNGATEVVVKQFKNQGLRRRLERRFRGSKAERSWRAAAAILNAGLRTPRPVALVESRKASGPSYLVTERLVDVAEVRFFFRRLNNDPDPGEFPECDTIGVLRSLGRLARRLHDAGIWYRDLSMGNILAEGTPASELDYYLVDTNRARVGSRMGLVKRCRDMSRLPILQREHREAFLAAYWGVVPRRLSPKWWLFGFFVNTYLTKHAVKNRLKRKSKVRGGSHGGTHHAHIPDPDEAASRRDRIVWDRLSDQPHQHANKLDKLAIRAADLPGHIYKWSLTFASVPKVWNRYRRLMKTAFPDSVSLDGVGVCVRPYAEDPAAPAALVEELGVQKVLLRLHPWENNHDAEEELARELRARGAELVFALPQNRDLVRDHARWRTAVSELGERFLPFGTHFQVGHAPNRSKWGVWGQNEYVELYVEAAEILRRLPGVTLLGPAIIDFEPYATLPMVNHRAEGFHFDILSNLLYVDRRGAPENTQLGFDTVNKAALLRAAAETGRSCGERCWVTEVNWPLWEGPHSPAGRTVSVDEDTQADYLPRYYLLCLCSGFFERVYWWQLIARGYGLATANDGGNLRRRPSFYALRTLVQQVHGAQSVGRLPSQEGIWAFEVQKGSEQIVAAWSVCGDEEIELPQAATKVVDRDGRESTLAGETKVVVSQSVRYFHLG